MLVNISALLLASGLAAGMTTNSRLHERDPRSYLATCTEPFLNPGVKFPK